MESFMLHRSLSSSAVAICFCLLRAACTTTTTASAFVLKAPTTYYERPTWHRQKHRLHLADNKIPMNTDDEWHPHDPAETTPQLLKGIWDQIASANNMVRGETDTVIYPAMQDKLTPKYLALILAHLDVCKDVCDNFGITTSIVPYQDKKTGKVTGFTVKSFKNPDKRDDFDFDYDPFWDEDDTDFESLYAGVDDEDMAKDPYPEIKNKVPENDDLIVDISKKWVGKIMSDMGVCPFTAGPEKAGLPIGNVFYNVDRSTTFEDMYAAFWHEVVRLEVKDERELSTTLLITPEFCMDNVELFETFSNTLTLPLTALEIDNLIQLIFFHPQWCFRDGSARAGEGQAANYARRSPWPMINILRTTQVRTAQKGIPTGLVYKQNEKTLKEIGVDSLETMLRLRDWGDIADMKVNRREYDALKIAQDYQQTGVIKKEDQSLAHDSTPAANKVDRSVVEKGNLVNVLVQALEKRLGKSDSSPAITQLSGPETSASCMAADVLMEELDRIATNSQGSEAVESSDTSKKSDTNALDDTEKSGVAVVSDKDGTQDEKAGKEAIEYKETDELKAAKAAQMEKARQAIFDDMREAEEGNSSPSRGDGMSNIIFGKGGIKAGPDEEDVFPEGMNPESFF